MTQCVSDRIWGFLFGSIPFLCLLLGAAAAGLLPQVLLIFAIVLWHETAHLLAAKLHRLDVTEVELLPFGGVARFEALLQTDPGLEWKVAVVGPLSNLLLMGLLFASRHYYAIPQNLYDFAMLANGGMFLFNLLPALPLDGGRILRSILVHRRGFREATELSALVAQILAAVMCCWGLYTLYLGYTGGAGFAFWACLSSLRPRRTEERRVHFHALHGP